MATQLWAVALVVIAVAIGAFGPIYLKRGARSFSLKPRKLIKNRNLLLGCSLYFLSTLFFVPALRGGELSVLYPLVSFSYVIVSFLSIRMLNERMNSWKWSGIALILIGITFIGLGS